MVLVTNLLKLGSIESIRSSIASSLECIAACGILGCQRCSWRWVLKCVDESLHQSLEHIADFALIPCSPVDNKRLFWTLSIIENCHVRNVTFDVRQKVAREVIFPLVVRLSVDVLSERLRVLHKTKVWNLLFQSYHVADLGYLPLWFGLPTFVNLPVNICDRFHEWNGQLLCDVKAATAWGIHRRFGRHFA